MSPVVERTDQNERRNTGTPSGIIQSLAAGIENRCRAEIRSFIIGFQIGTDSPEHRNGAAVPTQQGNAIFAREVLLLQPIACSPDVRNAFAIGPEL